jgi:hypothetical protein
MQQMGRRLGAIALLAMLVRAIVPAGYMLATAETAHGRYLTITICDSHAGATQVLDLTTGKLVDPSGAPAKHPDKVEHAPCVFAIAAPMAPPAVNIEPATFVTVQSIAPERPRDVRPGEGIAAPPPPSTGPPVSI